MQYRREIDGLRAVAVLPVILFHAGFSVFSGGYVGVDVFFVISGYLITSILISELEQGNFSILRFYERRARRILPALFVVMLACLPFAYMWMFPTQLKDFAQSLVAVVFFASNVLFWRESGYFAADAELKPLLHTWSLAVEEQYYLIFPIFLLLAWRFGRNKVFWSVVVIAAISLLLAEWGWRNKPTANFYLAPTRAWELLAGSICAFLTVGRTLKSNNVLSAIGLAAIVFAIFVFDENTPFPSVYALVPVVGTALIILFGRQGTWVANLLSLRAFVGIGLISYSAYLWHQPLFAFARIRSLTEPSHILMAGLAVVALLLAWATWRWVEQPIRHRNNGIFKSRTNIFILSGFMSLIFIFTGISGHLNKGFFKHQGIVIATNIFGFRSEELAARAKVSGIYPNADSSFIDKLTGLPSFQGTSDKITYVIGDSHALQYMNSVNTYYDLNTGLVSNTTIFNSSAPFPPTHSNFPEAFDERIDTVVISYFWALKFGSNSVLRHVRCCGDGPDGRIGGNGSVSDKTLDEMDGYELALSDFVKNLLAAEKRVIIILDNPFGEELDPTNFIEIAGRTIIGFSPPRGGARTMFETRRSEINERLIRISEQFGASIIDPFDFLCSPTWCSAVSPENHFIYKDYDHLSPYMAANGINFINYFFE